MAGTVGSRRKAVPQFEMGPEHRLKIANSNVLKCLIQHAEGTREMSATQVTAGLGLLRKVMPDLSESKNDVTIEQRFVIEVPALAETVEEWQKLTPLTKSLPSSGARKNGNGYS